MYYKKIIKLKLLLNITHNISPNRMIINDDQFKRERYKLSLKYV